MRWQTLASMALGAVAAALVVKGYRDSRQLQMTRQTVFIPELPAAFDGFTLLQLSDLHFAPDSTWPARLLAAVDTLCPDLVVLTGDFVKGHYSASTVKQFLAALADRVPVFAIFGNADYRPNLSTAERSEWERILPFLRNHAQAVTRDGAQLWVAGVDDPHLNMDDLSAALAPVPPDVPVILLAHSPEIIAEPLDPRVRLILSGHTHGGQICLPDGSALYSNTILARRYASGRHQVGNAILYVSRGVGSTRLPLRLWCLPEITLFTLTRNG